MASSIAASPATKIMSHIRPQPLRLRCKQTSGRPIGLVRKVNHPCTSLLHLKWKSASSVCQIKNMTTLTLSFSMYSCPSIFSTLQIYTVYIYISWYQVLVCKYLPHVGMKASRLATWTLWRTQQGSPPQLGSLGPRAEASWSCSEMFTKKHAMAAMGIYGL